ncbi:MAG: InlB B-repeat-containing protein [Candidatus Limiplasma sp.]|nr:InlB B-repeat-containing protein [Candidatus Limiplasma sp.]
MKRFFCVLLVALALVGLMTTVASAEEYATVISDNGYGVRMREGPGKVYRVVTTYDVGTTVIVQQRGTEWSQIRVGETVGWMMNEFLNFGTSGTGDGTGGESGGVGTGTVVSDNGLRVWLRTTPGGKRIQLYRPGTSVTILAYGDEWHHVSIGGVRGYMMSRYISVTPPPAPSSKMVEAVSVNYPSPVVDDVLQASVTPSDATVTYSWKVNGVEQSNSATLRVLNEYIGKPITLTVTGTGVYYGSRQYTTDPVVSSRQVTGVSLNRSQPFVGDTLSAVLKPSSATVSYSWRVGGIEVSTEATYTVQESDIGKLIQLKVSGIDSFSGVAICSASGEVRSSTEVFSVDLSIKNRPVMVGEVLSSVVTPSSASVNCVWMADGDVVATTASYKVTANDLGKKISLKVEGIAPYTGSATASAYGLVQSANITAVALNNYTLTAGNGCYAVLTPGNATATYEWIMVNATTGAESVFATGSYITVPETAIGHRIKVRVRGAGIYGVSTFNAESGVDYIDSPLSNPIISNKIVTGVALNNTNPVIGETITVDLTPDALDPLRASGQLSYVWTVGTETYTDTTGTYTVKNTDVGKAISVKAITAYPNAGEAISPATNPVRGNGTVAGVSIINQRTNANAGQTAPEVGDTLVASLNPWTAASVPGWISYGWYVDGAQVGTASTLTIDPAWNGKQITLIADVAAGCPYYNGSKQPGEYPNRHSATTAAVAQYAAVNADIYITQPVAGEAPQVSVSGSGVVNNQTVEVCNGSITWFDKATGALAVLDSKGHFKPQTTYIARLTLNANHGLSWNNATVKVNGAAATQLTKAGNVFDFEFTTTGQLPITQFYISGVPRPVPGGSPSVVSYSTDQYTATIDWSSCLDSNTGTFKNASSYTVPITITANPGYTDNGIAPNVFKVSTADATTSTAGTGAGITVTATFNVDHDVTVTAERTTINIDGVNVAVVQCFANVSNMVEQPTFTWSVQYKQSDSTWINENGVLNVGPDEILDKDIVVWATCTVDGKTYQGSLALHLVSGTQEDTSIKPVFNGNQPTSVLAGTKAQYSAYATNSVMGVQYAIEGHNSSGTTIDKDTGLLTVAADETAPSINVVVWPKQAPGERVKTNVQIIRTYTVTYTDGQGGALFADVVYRNLQLDAATPKYNDANIPAVPGWEFDSWTPAYTEKVTGNVTYVAQWKTSSVTPGLPNTLDLLPEDLQNAEGTFTVTYTDGVEDAVIFNDQVTSGLLAGDATPAMTDPVREGYRFDGWEPAVTETVTANTTYTAKWTKLYNIVFLDGTEENNVVLSQQVAEGENTPLPANPTREGYDFTAWIDQNGNGWGDSASKPVTGDATYTATWRAHDAVDGNAGTLENAENTSAGVRVVVTNGVDGGVIGEADSQTIMDAYAYVQSLPAPTHPTDPAMVFAGWSDFHYDEASGVVTFEATWKGVEPEQPTDTPEEPQPEQPTDTPEEPQSEQPTDVPEEQQPEQPTDVPEEPQPEQQPVEEGPVLYTVTYTDGLGGELSSYQLEEGSSMPGCAAPARDLFVFTGWNPAVAETVTADVTYEAQWADDWNANGIPDAEDARYTVTYKDGDTVLKEDTVLTGMDTPGCAAPEVEGMAFAGWSPAVAGTVTADATYVAQWSEITEEEAEESKTEPEGEAASEGGEPVEGEEDEEIDDETLEKEYEALAESSNIHISFEKGASRIGRGKSSTYVVKVSGIPEGVQASISWRLSGKDLVATKGQASGEGFRVTVGEGETAETVRVVVTVKVGDITISRGKRVSIVDPTALTEDEKKETIQPTEKPAGETEDGSDTSEEDAATEPTDPPAMSEEEMGQQAMEEGNSDPAASSF